MTLNPPVSEWNTQDILQVPAPIASVISMNMQIILHGPPSTVKTSLHLPLLSLTSARHTDHSSMPDLFHLVLSFLSVVINDLNKKGPESTMLSFVNPGPSFSLSGSFI